MFHTVLLIVAFVAFLFAAVGINTPRLNLLAFGLACYVLAALVP